MCDLLISLTLWNVFLKTGKDDNNPASLFNSSLKVKYIFTPPNYLNRTLCLTRRTLLLYLFFFLGLTLHLYNINNYHTQYSWHNVLLLWTRHQAVPFTYTSSFNPQFTSSAMNYYSPHFICVGTEVRSCYITWLTPHRRAETLTQVHLAPETVPLATQPYFQLFF